MIRRKVRIRFWKLINNITKIKQLVRDVREVVIIGRKVSKDPELRVRLSSIENILEELF